MRNFRSALTALLVLLLSAFAWAAEPTPQQLRFFETNVRPVLVEHCQKCHGPEKQWANLRLDSRERCCAAAILARPSSPASRTRAC